ncbi:MAG: UbiD family decarboxylase [Candidatus Lokiarchaeota archaeon]|nr:UbiD family decarboxylase [Candidatus Lokiarchaeota archaeon]
MNFRNFIKTLEPIYIEENFDLKFEIAAILKKFDGKPIYFSKYNLIGNIYSNPDLLSQSIGLKDFSEWIPFFLKARYNFGKLVKHDNFPKMKKISLKDLPILTHYEKDAGKYITSDAIIATKNGRTNVSTHRILILNEKELTLRIVRRHLYEMVQDAINHGEDLPITMCIGVPSSVQIAAATSLDPLENELELAAALEGGELKVKDGLPESEIIIKGKILHDKVVEEGPFVDITSKYDIIRKEPVFKIDEVLAREDYIYHALLPGANDHQLLMGMPRVPIIYDEIKKQNVDVKKVYLNPDGFGWLKTIISIKKKENQDIKKVLDGTLKAHYSTKVIIVVDEDVNVTNDSEIQNALCLNTKFDENNPIVLKNIKGSSLDPRAEGDMGSKILIDATKPINYRRESFEQGKIPFDEKKLEKIKLRRKKIA